MDDVKKIKMSREQCLEFKLLGSELERWRATAQAAQAQFENSAKALQQWQAGFKSEVLGDGSYEIVSEDWNTGDIAIKLTDLGKAQQVEATQTPETPQA